MPEITLDVRKSIEQNAAEYFEKSKKEKKKLEGALLALQKNRSALERIERQKQARDEQRSPAREKKWHEKFRWFISSEGFLCVGGRDATSNEVIVKKHTEPADILFHAEVEGSPFFVIKCLGKPPGEATLQEAAVATASFSRGWKLGLSYLDVYYVKPEQVSKQARPGEYLGKGAFMIYGKKNIIAARMGLAVGSYDRTVMCGPLDAVRKNCGKFAQVKQGMPKPSEAAKKIKKRLGLDVSVDDIIRVLPPGGVEVGAL